ncbi:hypothetical protein D3C76_1790230 [compost metagenome]
MLYCVQHFSLFLREVLYNVVVFATFWAWDGERAQKCCRFYNISVVGDAPADPANSAESLNQAQTRFNCKSALRDEQNPDLKGLEV